MGTTTRRFTPAMATSSTLVTWDVLIIKPNGEGSTFQVVLPYGAMMIDVLRERYDVDLKADTYMYEPA